jgi:hypothetical protein
VNNAIETQSFAVLRLIHAKRVPLRLSHVKKLILELMKLIVELN